MIYQAINCIKSQLNPAIVIADIGNIADVAGTNAPGDIPDILITLINIEENRISREQKNYVQSGPILQKKNPAIHLNLTLLFSAIKNTTSYEYEKALDSLQKVILFFQGKYVFDHLNTPGLDARIEKLVLEMVSLNAEQLNNTWSILGSKYHPSVVYLVRMITIDSVSSDTGDLITEVKANFIK